MTIVHFLSVEILKCNQEWIKINCPPRYLVADVREFLRQSVWDLMSDSPKNIRDTLLPELDGKSHYMIAGFSCKSLSAENNERSAYGNCVVDGTGSTGTCFLFTLHPSAIPTPTHPHM